MKRRRRAVLQQGQSYAEILYGITKVSTMKFWFSLEKEMHTWILWMPTENKISEG